MEDELFDTVKHHKNISNFYLEIQNYEFKKNIISEKNYPLTAYQMRLKIKCILNTVSKSPSIITLYIKTPKKREIFCRIKFRCAIGGYVEIEKLC